MRISSTLLLPALVSVTSILAGCVAPQSNTAERIQAEMREAQLQLAARTEDNLLPGQSAKPAVDASVTPNEGRGTNVEQEPRFNIAFNDLPAPRFFMSLVEGTGYSMMVAPEVTGTISANLKNVTVVEALQAVREMYGYDFRMEGSRILVKAPVLQTRVFRINYLSSIRDGNSQIRVTSGSLTDNPSPATNSFVSQGQVTMPGATQRSLHSSNITTRSNSDFWAELKSSLEAIVAVGKDGRSVVLNPQSGVVVVRGMWNDIRDVTEYLRATQKSVDRQVILEAKIVEVQLNEEYKAGINWAAFTVGGNSRFGAALLTRSPLAGTTSSAADKALSGGFGNLFGIAFQSSNFTALLSFLETQGNVHVLSSPRIATLNNQKAVLKVGTDEYFVTGVSTTTTTGTATTTTPNVTLQPFFSGVALDVTPQLDDEGNITLHVHPSVSSVKTVERVLNLGASAGTITLPLASSAVSETDSVVRGRDGQVIALGGLMRESSLNERAGIPGAGNLPSFLAPLFGNISRTTEKRELVILIKPTVVHQGETESRPPGSRLH